VPTILDPETMKDVVISESEALRRLDNGQGLLRKQLGAPGVHLWDVVDGTLSGPFPSDLAYTFYLRKVVSKCSACTYSGLFEKDVEAHLRDVQVKARSHRNARMKQEERHGELSEICTACGAAYSLMRGKGADHIVRTLHAGPRHEGAKVLTIRRYSVAPPAPEPVSTGVLDFPASANGKGAVASQSAVEVAQNPRRRKRRHNRRGRDGH